MSGLPNIRSALSGHMNAVEVIPRVAPARGHVGFLIFEFGRESQHLPHYKARCRAWHEVSSLCVIRKSALAALSVFLPLKIPRADPARGRVGLLVY